MPLPTPFRLLLALSLVALSAGAALAANVRVESLNGVARVTLEGSFVGARYTVNRALADGSGLTLVGERDALCTGDCYVLDQDALVGATYQYTFDVTGSTGTTRFGPFDVTIGGRAAHGLALAPSPNPLRDRGTVRVTAAIPAGARAGNASAATNLPGEVTLVDPSGRVLRTLWKGTLDRLTFDVPVVAQDSRGQQLPAGLYFVVLRAGEHRSIARVAVVR
ncbi:MAG: hypothetical protein K8R56_06110 [Candidatus Eisenbacteria bacterium]|nr:hypothetical protein [Candidatus Eisenbacteria bacterium]